MGSTIEDFPGAPDCPTWCECHDSGSGWDVHPAAVTKTCRRVIECDGGAEIQLERFASIEDSRVIIEAAAMRVLCVEALSIAAALTLGHAVRRVAEIVSEALAFAA